MPGVVSSGSGKVRRSALALLLGPCLLSLGSLAGCERESQAQPLVSTEVPGAAELTPALNPGSRYLAQIEAHTVEEFARLLQRAEAAITEDETYPQFEPIEFILHGSEAAFFVRSNYPQFREIVDRAARLDAFGVIDIKICEGWMSLRNVQRAELPAFVETVPYGPAAEKQLLREGYIYF